MAKRATLTERAELSRQLAADHYATAERIRRLADQMMRDALDMDAGVDPFRCRRCHRPLFGDDRYQHQGDCG